MFGKNLFKILKRLGSLGESFPKNVCLLMAASILIFTGQSTQADLSVSFGIGYSTPDYGYYGDRINSEYRRGYQTDDWIERGSSSVTESPIYSDGIRLSAWATRDEDDYDYALASAIYYFEIPSSARSIKIKIYYDGKVNRDDFDDDVAGRAWIRKTAAGDDTAAYYPDEGRYDKDVDQPLYGDTFVLPEKKHLEIIRLSARDHVNDDDIMELHVVAEDRQRIDVKYIEVETYTSLPAVRVVTRYYNDYVWRPWYDYAYWYFYVGPVYNYSDYYYVRYIYPDFNRRYIEVRRHYNDYLNVYYINRPHNHIRWVDVAPIHRGSPRNWDRSRLGRWTSDHEEIRRSYEITSMKTRNSADVRVPKERIRSVLSSNSRPSPSVSRIRSGESSSSSASEMKQRREASDQRTAPEVRTRVIERAPDRAAAGDNTKSRRDIDIKSSITTQQKSDGKERGSVKQEASKKQEERKVAPSDDSQIKKKRESTRSSQESKKEEPRKVEKAPRKEETKTPEVKKDDEEEDKDKDKDKNKDSTDGSSARKKIRSR